MLTETGTKPNLSTTRDQFVDVFSGRIRRVVNNHLASFFDGLNEKQQGLFMDAAIHYVTAEMVGRTPEETVQEQQTADGDTVHFDPLMNRLMAGFRQQGLHVQMSLWALETSLRLVRENLAREPLLQPNY